MAEMLELGKRAKAAAAETARWTSGTKNQILAAIRDALLAHTAQIVAANEQDLARGRQNGLSESLLDRLRFDAPRVKGVADALGDVIGLADPVGRTVGGSTHPNGMTITKVTTI